MQCLKCGKETKENQVFCEHCLQTMAQYPVKSDTAIQLPRSAEPAANRKKPAPRRRALSQEEQIIQLKKRLHQVLVCAGILLVALCLATALLLQQLLADQPQPLGTNYNIDTTQIN